MRRRGILVRATLLVTQLVEGVFYDGNRLGF